MVTVALQELQSERIEQDQQHALAAIYALRDLLRYLGKRSHSGQLAIGR